MGTTNSWPGAVYRGNGGRTRERENTRASEGVRVELGVFQAGIAFCFFSLSVDAEVIFFFPALGGGGGGSSGIEGLSQEGREG